jgi:hypothetical protein
MVVPIPQDQHHGDPTDVVSSRPSPLHRYRWTRSGGHEPVGREARSGATNSFSISVIIAVYLDPKLPGVWLFAIR